MTIMYINSTRNIINKIVRRIRNSVAYLLLICLFVHQLLREIIVYITLYTEIQK